MSEAEKLLRELERRAALDPRLRGIMRKIADNSADFKDTAAYANAYSSVLGSLLSGSILNADDREYLCRELLKAGYDEVNEVCRTVQESLDAAQGIRIVPQRADFPEERANQLAHSLIDPTVSDSVIVRRAKSGAENIARSFHDDYIEANAKFRSTAGFRAYVTRIAGSKACKWCESAAGRFVIGEQPDNFFGRHDNCTCTIIYDGQVLHGDSVNTRAWVHDSDIDDSLSPHTLGADEAEETEKSLLSTYHNLTSGRGSGRIKLNNRFYKEGDDPALAVFGRAEESNPEELVELKERLNKIGVKITYHSDQVSALAYQNTRLGEPGTISVPPEVSFSAWLHEAQHAFDDEASGWNACYAVWDVDEHIRREKNAYQKEIDYAMKHGRPDVSDSLKSNLETEIANIKKRDEEYARAFESFEDGGE